MEAVNSVVSAEARKGEDLVLSAEAWRVSGGIRFLLIGGREINYLFKRLSELAGHIGPSPLHGLPVYREHRTVQAHTGIALADPPSPMIGPWILRHSELGMKDEGLTFDLPMPHSKTYVKQQLPVVTDAARKIYMEFCRAIRVKRDVVAQNPLGSETWNQITSGGFSLNPELDQQLTAELQRMLRAANRY